jgi:hypothetical protein
VRPGAEQQNGIGPAISLGWLDHFPTRFSERVELGKKRRDVRICPLIDNQKVQSSNLGFGNDNQASMRYRTINFGLVDL